ncbi:hypothetical protein NXW98_22370 [Bacteroides caccae]|nr:hypothetical protein [Bacteroides caccae]MCS3193862.1 hypothetical protein [Bacteroides caccae]
MTEEVSQPKTSKNEKDGEKAVTAKSTPPNRKSRLHLTAPTAKPAMENKEVKAENTAKPADPGRHLCHTGLGYQSSHQRFL